MSGNFNLADYATVDERIDKYWQAHPKPEGSIQTEIIWVSNDGYSVAIKATVYQGDRILATGIAQEERLTGLDKYGKPVKGANASSWWENCETSAIGRALANMGMSLSKRASREEMQKVQRYEDDDGHAAAQPAPPPANQTTRDQSRRSGTSSQTPSRPAAAQVAAGPPYTDAEYDKVIDAAWQKAEDGETLDAIKEHINSHWARIPKPNRPATVVVVDAIARKWYAPASVAG